MTVCLPNEKGGFTIPTNVTLPSVTPPGRLLPPIGHFFPEFGPPRLPGGASDSRRLGSPSRIRWGATAGGDAA